MSVSPEQLESARIDVLAGLAARDSVNQPRPASPEELQQLQDLVNSKPQSFTVSIEVRHGDFNTLKVNAHGNYESLLTSICILERAISQLSAKLAYAKSRVSKEMMQRAPAYWEQAMIKQASVINRQFHLPEEAVHVDLVA